MMKEMVEEVAKVVREGGRGGGGRVVGDGGSGG